MFNKKAAIDPLKYIMIAILSGFIFIFFIVLLTQNANLTIDEKKINTQLVLSKLFNGQCFSNDFATFEELKLDEENLKNCFKNKDEKIMFRIKVLSQTDYLYAGDNEKDFNSKKAFCGVEGNILCARMVYPIVFINSNGDYSIEKMLVETLMN